MADNSQAKKKTDYPAQKVNKKVTLCDRAYLTLGFYKYRYT